MPLTEKQHQARESGLGGSDAAPVAGLSPYKSPLDVWLEKTGQSVPVVETERMAWGARLEPLIAEEFARRNGVKVARVNTTLRHPDHPFMVGHIDRRIVGQDAILECKATGLRVSEETGPIEAHQVQVLHYMALRNASVGFIAYLVGGNKYLQFRVERDEGAIEALIKIEAAFWRHVQDRTPPPPVNLADVARLYPGDAGVPVLAPDGIVAEYQRLAELRAQIKAAEADAEAAELAIKAAMGEAPVLLGPDGRALASWKVQRAHRLDQQRLKAEAPEIYQQFSMETTSRVFRLKTKEVK